MSINHNRDEDAKNKQELRTLENMYVTSQIENLDELVQKKKEELTIDIMSYNEKFKYCTNPVIIQKYFFKSINPISWKEPEYTAEKLGIVWDLYNDIVLEVNARVGEFNPNLTSFCTFAGITLNTLRNWKKSEDIDMRIIVEKIYDSCYDNNVSLAQAGRVKERSTIYRMKSEQGRAEAEQPQIHIHNEGEINFDAINKRLQELQGFNERKKKENNVIEVEKVEQ